MTYLSQLHNSKLWPALARIHGIIVTYRRNGSVLGSLTLVKGRQNVELYSGEMTISVLADEWVARRSELMAVGADRPEEHDRIEWADALGQNIICEVRLISRSERQWAPIDTEGNLVQVLTVEVAT